MVSGAEGNQAHLRDEQAELDVRELVTMTLKHQPKRQKEINYNHPQTTLALWTWLEGWIGWELGECICKCTVNTLNSNHNNC